MFYHSKGRDVVLSKAGICLCNVERLPNSLAVKAFFITPQNSQKETAAGGEYAFRSGDQSQPSRVSKNCIKES
jgi:hypothetical protein